MTTTMPTSDRERLNRVLALHSPLAVHPLVEGVADLNAKPVVLLCRHCTSPEVLITVDVGEYSQLVEDRLDLEDTRDAGEPWPCPTAVIALDTDPVEVRA